MELKHITLENLEEEHICCAISEKKGEHCISSKKAWLKERMQEGLSFVKLDVRGKVFIEYIPAEYAWYPIKADGYMHIDCFWIAGQYKGQGYANRLLAECMREAKEKGMKGITMISAKKKLPYTNEGSYCKYKGFKIADTYAPSYELLYYPFDESAEVPSFQIDAMEPSESEFVLYYTNQCPHCEKYAPMLKIWLQERGYACEIRKIDTLEKAKHAPCVITTYSLFRKGEFLTNEILSEKSLDKKILGVS